MDYYVTQSGAGSHDGSSGNEWSVAEFNALTGTGYAGDTFYFSGTITSQLVPNISGTSGGGYVTLDGWKDSSCDPVADDACASAAVIDRPSRDAGLSNYCISLVGNSYLVIQDFVMQDSRGGIYSIGPTSGTTNATHLTIRRNHITEMDGKGMQITTTTGGGYLGHDYVTIGGAMGDGNVISDCDEQAFSTYADSHNCGVNGGDDIIVSYNSMINSNPQQDDASNILSLHAGDRVLVEYNTIAYPHGQAAAVFKEYGGTQKIFRFNKCYGAGQQGGLAVIAGRGVDPEPYQDHYYIYGNKFYDGAGGIQLNRSYDEIRIWSNIFHDLSAEEEAAGGRGGLGLEFMNDPDNIAGDVYVYNNTIVRADVAGDRTASSGLVIIGGDPQLVRVKNNIFYYNASDATDRQIYVYPGQQSHLSTLDYNTFYTSGTPYIYYDSADKTVAQMNTEFSVTHNKAEDPVFTNPIEDDFTLQGTSPSINDGEDLSSCFQVTVQGIVHNICYDDGLDDVNTDWATNPPTVVVVKQEDYSSWDRGAYIYTRGGGVNQAPNGTITSPASNPTVDIDDTVTLAGTHSDPEGDPCTYAWVIAAHTFEHWAVGTTYSIGDIVEYADGSGTYYRSKVNNNTGNTPAIDANWENAETVQNPGTGVCDVAGVYSISLTVSDDAPLADPTPAMRTITVNAAGGTSPTTEIWSQNTTGTYTGDYTEGTDTYISSGTTSTNYGTHNDFKVQYVSWGGDYNYKALLSFDLDHVNISGETVTNAILGLQLELNPSTVTTNIELWSCDSAFVEDQATWSIYSTGNSWASIDIATGHGRDTFLAETQFTTSSAENTWYTWSSEALTSYIGTVAATGGTAYFLLIADVHASGQVEFHSDNATNGDMPYLQISYGASAASTPEVVSITTNTVDGEYKDGDSIGPFLVTFNESVTVTVTVTGTPHLTLELGTNDVDCNYSSGSGTPTLTFVAFTVSSASSHTSADLDGKELDLNSGTIVSTDDSTSVAVTGELLDSMLTGATIGSLAYNKAIVIDTSTPTVSSVNNTDSHATANSTITTAGTLVKFAIVADSTGLVVYAAPGFPRIEMTVNLSDTVYANYIGVGDDTDAMIYGFYTTAGMRSTDLNFAGDIDVGEGGSIKDAAGNDIDTSMGALTLAGVAAIELAVPYPSTSPKEFTSTNTWAAAIAAGWYSIPRDNLDFNVVENIDTDNSGTKQNRITITGVIDGDAIFDEDYWTLINLNVTGSMTITGKHVEVQ